jgi:hypothetical protein
MSKKLYYTNLFRPDTMVVQCRMARADMIMVSRDGDDVQFDYRTTVYNERAQKEEMHFGSVVMDPETFSAFVEHLNMLKAALVSDGDADPWNADDGEAHPFYNTKGIIDDSND